MIASVMLGSTCHHQLHRFQKIAAFAVCRNGVHSRIPFAYRNVSATTGTTTNETAQPTLSANKEFKLIPVEPTILKYIDMIGVGRINLAALKSKRLLQRRRKSGRKNSMSVIDETQERAFFENQDVRNRLHRERRSVPGKIPTSSWLPPPPFGGTLRNADTEESGRRIKRLPVKIVGSDESSDAPFPRNLGGLPEVALAGRSNVGKSTLLNALLYGNQPHKETGGPIERKRGRAIAPEGAKLPKGVKAVTSDRPGETKKITFFKLSAEVHESDKHARKLSLLLVDLPGYGFAFASEERSSSWSELMTQYLVERGKSLKRILLLIDARHGMKKADFDFLDSLQAALYSGAAENHRKELTPIQIVLTKCDLVDRRDLARRVVLVRQQLSGALRREPSSLPVMLVSARAGVGFNNVKGERARGGILELQKELAALVPNNNKPETRMVGARPLASSVKRSTTQGAISSRKGAVKTKFNKFKK